MKYFEGAATVASLAVMMPSVAKKLNEMLQIFCFPTGTEVATGDGQKAIEQIKVGDLVWAQDDRTGEVSLKPVKQLFVNVAAALVVLHCGTNTLEATPEHPLWVADQGWKAAGQIQPGDELWTRSGDRVTVTDIGHKQGQFTVCNFEVADAHSYFVGRDELLAHNKCTQLTFFDRHHSLPKFLGGDPDQMLTYLSRAKHQELTELIASKLEQAGLQVRKSGGKFVSSSEWAAILKDDDAKQKAFNALADATREFDQANGTKVMHDLWKNIFNP
ncbi:MAG: polymorphic toxin-type HINT domain-containing protein [Verrucomicrobiota bacterium]